VSDGSGTRNNPGFGISFWIMHPTTWMGVLFKREACYGQIFAKHLAEMKKMYYSILFKSNM